MTQPSFTTSLKAKGDFMGKDLFVISPGILHHLTDGFGIAIHCMGPKVRIEMGCGISYKDTKYADKYNSKHRTQMLHYIHTYIVGKLLY